MRVFIQNPQSLGSMVRDARTRKGWTQAELGRQVNMHQKDVSLLERDPGNAKFSRLLAVCALLELKMAVEEAADSATDKEIW